jgi:serine O-acetyltransferase
MKLALSMPTDELENYVLRLLSHHIPDKYVATSLTKKTFSIALQRLEFCFSNIHKKYYCQNGVSNFDHLNTDHMATFLYFLGNTIWNNTGDDQCPTRLFYLNKILHGLDLFYSVKMPDIFLLVHPVGTVLGNACYENYFVAYQNCTVGALTDAYPAFKEGAILYSGCTVLGSCRLGENVVLAANSMLISTDVPDNSLVLGQYPHHKFVSNSKSVRERCFEDSPTVGN